MLTSELPSDGILQVCAADDLLLDGGAWKLTEDQKGQPIAIITPPVTPMFQQVVAYLETKPVPFGGNMRRADEARAAVAVCLRWGSYFAVLADPLRPPAPDLDDEQVSQIDDEEMARMNIEISAALAWWLTLLGSDDRRYWDLVHRALAYLPTGPKRFDRHHAGDVLLACTMPQVAAEASKIWPPDRLAEDLEKAGTYGIRVIANSITHLAWRNGPIEDVHAGRFQGYGLNQRRVLPKAEKAIVRQAQQICSAGLKAADFLKYDNAWPPPAQRVLPFLHGFVAPSRWSCTELSRIVELALRQDGQTRP